MRTCGAFLFESGLRAVAGLLEQPGVTTPSSANSTSRFRNGPFVSLSEVGGSDTEESPYTGERPNVMPKVGERGRFFAERILIASRGKNG